MKVAIVYDRVNKWGGAERTLLVLHEIFPEAPLYTSLYSPEKATWARVFPKVIPSFLNKIKYFQDKHELLNILMPIAFESLSSGGEFDKYDLVISVTSEAAKGIITKPKTKHLCYCLTPTRYLWSHYDHYFRNRLFRYISSPFVSYLKRWDEIAAQRPDVFVAISKEVQERIKKFYKRDSYLIYPPVDIEKFKKVKPENKSKAYYLIVSRLVSYKRVDLAIEAFAQLKLPLVIVGTGVLEKKFRSKYRSNKNIVFKGFVPDEELLDLYQGAKAFIYPQEEDFGITAVEAQAAGIPVIAYRKGGALDTIIQGKTGIFFESQTKESLIRAILAFNRIKDWSREDCVQNAQRFSKERFKSEFKSFIENL